MPIIFGVIASEESGHLQPQPPIIDTTSGAVVISGGTTSGSNSIVQVAFTSNPYGQRATSYAITAFSGSPLVAITGTTVTGANSPLNITYPFVANAYYQFKGTATNAKGTSSYGIASNQVEPFVATVTPSGLSVNIISTSGTRFTFLQVPGATSYLLSANGSYTDPTTNITTTDSASVIISGAAIGYSTVSGILNHGYFVGMPYNFFVQSQNFAGTSASGANISLTPNPFGPPLAPVFTATKSGTSNPVINVVITPDTNTLDNLPTGYFIGDSTGGFSSITQLGVTTTLSNTTTPIQPVSTINVLAKNGYTGASGTAGTPVVLNFLPATPASVSASVTTPASGFNAASASGTVAVSWSQTSNAQYSAPTGYTITATAAGYTTISTTSTTTSVNLSGLFNVNIPYTVSVTANNAAGTSSAGTASSTVTPYVVAAPSAITGTVTATVVNTTSATVSWTTPSTGGPYSNVYVSSTPSLALTPSSVASGTSTITPTGAFVAGTAYTFSVYTSNATGTSTADTSNLVTPNPKPTVSGTSVTYYSDSSYDYAVWSGTGSFTVSVLALNNAEFVLVGGGGGGGAYKTLSVGTYAPGGGGGAGAVYQKSATTLSVNPYTITVGAGGLAGSSSNGGQGGATTFQYSGTVIYAAFGGGYGAYNAVGGDAGGTGAPAYTGANGAGGGGANLNAGGRGISAGGTGYGSGSNFFAGGGGGVGGAGAGGATTSNGGTGITLTDSAWAAATSTSVAGYYGGGGGGGEANNNSGVNGAGGAGGGGTGASLAANATQATAGTAKTGGGGGGAAGPSYSTAGAGGSGLFMIRWPKGTATILI